MRPLVLFALALGAGGLGALLWIWANAAANKWVVTLNFNGIGEGAFEGFMLAGAFALLSVTFILYLLEQG